LVFPCPAPYPPRPILARRSLAGRIPLNVDDDYLVIFNSVVNIDGLNDKLSVWGGPKLLRNTS